MDRGVVHAYFDEFVATGVVLFDDQQEQIEHVEDGLKFQFLLTPSTIKKPLFQQPPSNPDPSSGRLEGSDIDTLGFEIPLFSSEKPLFSSSTSTYQPAGTRTHFIVANKFALARPHFLVLTSSGFRRQHEPLDRDDFEFAWFMLHSLPRREKTLEGGSKDYLAFFNCGRDSGCSRVHKHMQVLPMRWSGSGTDSGSKGDAGQQEPEIPFSWFYQRFEKEDMTAPEVEGVYANLLAQAETVGQTKGDIPDNTEPGAACPHNVIFTRRWMVVIPRRLARVSTEVGTNALGMLGVIPVGTSEEIESWVRLGVKKALAEMGVPRSEEGPTTKSVV
ncbi:uncharacterized protein C8A04DRAFT_16003 [Dichotomopilus funicola]|uniref:ATP adenylyltransferase n=1 Tax=Dichotomopilus funicola TaxID=1934379 RepID=A0AAN6UUF0_9PEZI|nr:hypothetical protein C8A04DRAFT_16003 [Dichotomopilus funicola]